MIYQLYILILYINLYITFYNISNKYKIYKKILINNYIMKIILKKY